MAKRLGSLKKSSSFRKTTGFYELGNLSKTLTVRQVCKLVRLTEIKCRIQMYSAICAYPVQASS